MLGRIKGEELKTAPRGYDKIGSELNKEKQYVFIKPLQKFIEGYKTIKG